MAYQDPNSDVEKNFHNIKKQRFHLMRKNSIDS